MKAIVLDVDGVIIDSSSKKKEIKDRIYKKYGIFDLPGVKEIMQLGVNRKVGLDMIYKIKPFDKEGVLREMNLENLKIENTPIGNEKIIDFIKENHENFLFFTNTSLSKDGLDRIFNSLNLKKYFKELFYFETGTKLENINNIIYKYNLEPKDILFIDDNINHIKNVEKTGVNLLYFNDKNIDIGKKMKNTK